MAAKKGGLGRGLDSLFAESAAGQGSKPSSLPLAEIEPDKNQPRKHFEPESLSELAESIRLHGVLQPIAVRPNPAGGYQIIAGERRWRAAREAGLTEIPGDRQGGRRRGRHGAGADRKPAAGKPEPGRGGVRLSAVDRGL